MYLVLYRTRELFGAAYRKKGRICTAFKFVIIVYRQGAPLQAESLNEVNCLRSYGHGYYDCIIFHISYTFRNKQGIEIFPFSYVIENEID